MIKEAKHQAPDAADHELNDIGRCDIESRADIYYAGNNWRLLSPIGQLYGVKVFHNSYEEIINVPVVRSVTAVLHHDGTVYTPILNEALLFGKLMDQSIINPNQIRSFEITVSDNPLDRTRGFGIDNKELFI